MPSSSSSPSSSSDTPLRNNPMLNQSLSRLTSFKRQVLGRNQPNAYRNGPYPCQPCVSEFPTAHSFAAHIGGHYRADETALMWAVKLVQQLAQLEGQLVVHTQALEKVLVQELKLLLEAQAQEQAQAQAPPPARPNPHTPVLEQAPAAQLEAYTKALAKELVQELILLLKAQAQEQAQAQAQAQAPPPAQAPAAPWIPVPLPAPVNSQLIGHMVFDSDKNSSSVSANTISNVLDFLFSKQIIQNSSSSDVGPRQVVHPTGFASSSSSMSRQPEDINKENIVEVNDDEVVASEQLVDLDLKL